MSTSYKQDIPPEGGFGVINVERNIPKRIVPNKSIALILSSIVLSCYYFNQRYRQKRLLNNVLEYDSYIALSPFIQAEKDRNFLKALYLNREEEAKLMKDAPGWKVGTYYGEPIYKTIPKNCIGPIDSKLFFAHRPLQDYKDGVRPDHDI